MTWEKFWSIIDRIRAKADMQDEAFVKQFLYTELINLPQDELLGFDCAYQWAGVQLQRILYSKYAG